MGECSYWRERLRLILEEYTGEAEAPQFPRTSIGAIFKDEKLVTVHPGESIDSALRKISDSEVTHALVQDSPTTIQGILCPHNSATMITSRNVRPVNLRVSQVMERRVCIEPETATMNEVASRIVYGSCPSALIVDARGTPLFIVSPQQLYDWFVSWDFGVESPMVANTGRFV